MRKWCVYKHTTPDGYVFYVGSGANPSRAFSRTGRPARWDSIVRHVEHFNVEIVMSTDRLEDARSLEKEMISELSPTANMAHVKRPRERVVIESGNDEEIVPAKVGMKRNFAHLTERVLLSYGWTEETLAHMLGVKQPTVNRLRHGKIKTPHYETAVRIVELYNARPRMA